MRAMVNLQCAISAVGSTRHECSLAARCDYPECSNFHIKEIGRWTSHISVSLGSRSNKNLKGVNPHAGHHSAMTSTLSMLGETSNDMFYFGFSFFKLLWASAPSPNNLIGIIHLRSASGSLLPAQARKKCTLTTSHLISFTLDVYCNLFSRGTERTGWFWNHELPFSKAQKPAGS